MKTTIFFIFNFLVGSVLTSNCANIHNYILPTSGETTRFTSILYGNYTIQALASFSNGMPKCDKITSSGVVRALAMKYVIDKANNNSNYTQWATIGMRLDDVCSDLPTTMARGIEVISLVRENSVCRADFLQCAKGRNTSYPSNVIQRATALIGTALSYTTIPLASLMSLYLIPQISFSASSRLLSKKDLYKSFFRTIPSDTNQISVMLDIMETFNWNFIFAIGSDDDYGKLGIEELKKQAMNRNICIPNTEYVAYRSPDTIKKKIVEVVAKIKNETKAKVVVLFCYLRNLGDLILAEAKNQRVDRIWLTSDAWNPSAENLPAHLQNQTHGILSVSSKRYKMPKFVQYMRDEITTNFECNMWLKYFMKNNYNCSPISISNNYFTGINNCSVSVEDLMHELSNLPGKTNNLIDAVEVLTRAIHNYLDLNCINGQSCSVPQIDSAKLTEIVGNITFTSTQGVKVKFDANGDPEYVFYTVDNLQWTNNGSFKYVTIGNWSKMRSNKKLLLAKEEIKWPYWFINQNKNEGIEDAYNRKYPGSRCKEDCQKGQYVIGKIGCCWTCGTCGKNNYSNTIMAEKCETCDVGYHTVNHITCVITPVSWVTYKSTEGLSVVIVSSVGLLFTLISSLLLFKFRQSILTDESSPHMITLSCILLWFSFLFGYLHIFEPTVPLCHSRNAFFFLLFMAYTGVLLIKSNIVKEYLERNNEGDDRKIFPKQLMFFLFLLVVEIAAIVGWLIADSDKGAVENQYVESGYRIEKRCFVEFTAARLVSTFIPSILLIIATFCAFRDRNLEHSFYEPKFLSFTCIAMCIITIAFLPTFKYVKGNFKGVVMAFTTSVFGFTYLACLILPKIYVGHAKRHGANFLPRPANPERRTDNDIDFSTQQNTSVGDIDATGEGRDVKVDSESVRSHGNGNYEKD